MRVAPTVETTSAARIGRSVMSSPTVASVRRAMVNPPRLMAATASRMAGLASTLPRREDGEHQRGVECPGRQPETDNGANGGHRGGRRHAVDVRDQKREAGKEEDPHAGRRGEHRGVDDPATHRLDDVAPDRPGADEGKQGEQRARGDLPDDPAPDRRAEGDARRGAADIEPDEHRNPEPDDDQRLNHTPSLRLPRHIYWCSVARLACRRQWPSPGVRHRRPLSGRDRHW